MATTYEPISTTTLASAAANITFSSISSAYTDLRLILVSKNDTGSTVIRTQFNADTATNYSYTYLSGNGTSASSSALQTVAYILLDGGTTTEWGMLDINLFNYAGSTYKTILSASSEDANGSGYARRTVGLWRSTAAISSIKLYPTSYNFAAGTTATLYGILKA